MHQRPIGIGHHQHAPHQAGSPDQLAQAVQDASTVDRGEALYRGGDTANGTTEAYKIDLAIGGDLTLAGGAAIDVARVITVRARCGSRR